MYAPEQRNHLNQYQENDNDEEQQFVVLVRDNEQKQRVSLIKQNFKLLFHPSA